MQAASICCTYTHEQLWVCVETRDNGSPKTLARSTLNRRSAIKMLRPELATCEQVVTRFLNAAKAVNLSDHQNIVNVYDYGDSPDGSVYFVMAFLEGETLDDLMHKRRPMAMPLLLHVFGQIASSSRPTCSWSRARTIRTSSSCSISGLPSCAGRGRAGAGSSRVCTPSLHGGWHKWLNPHHCGVSDLLGTLHSGRYHRHQPRPRVRKRSALDNQVTA
jgi:serine/threonine protein kinase